MARPIDAERWGAEKRAVADAARRLAVLGLVTGSSGNVSARVVPAGNLMAITPAGKRYAELEGGDVVVADFEVETVEDGLPPSSESLLHAAIYVRRPDVEAVVHTHSTFATVAAVGGDAIPPLVDEMVIYAGGAIEVSEYAFPGTQELADAVCDALGPRNAALIRNHGAVAVGRDLAEAVDLATLVERVAQVFVFTSLMGKAVELPSEVVAIEKALFEMRKTASGEAEA